MEGISYKKYKELKSSISKDLIVYLAFKLIEHQKDYIQLLEEEFDKVLPHTEWKITRSEKGKELRQLIDDIVKL